MEQRRVLLRTGQLVPRERKRKILSGAGGLDLDQPLGATALERQNVVAEAIALIAGPPTHESGEITPTLVVMQTALFQFEDELLTFRAECPVLRVQPKEIDLRHRRQPRRPRCPAGLWRVRQDVPKRRRRGRRVRMQHWTRLRHIEELFEP